MRQTATSLQGYKIAALTSHAIHMPEYQRSSCSPAVRSVNSFEFPSAPKRKKKTPAIELQYSSQILKHLSDFPLPNVDLGLQSFQCSKIRSAQHWGRRGAHLSENKGVKCECKKIGENSRLMAPVSTICDEHCSEKRLLAVFEVIFVLHSGDKTRKKFYFWSKTRLKKYILHQYQRRNTSAYCKKALKSFNFVSGKHPAAVR